MPSLSAYKNIGKSLSNIHRTRGAMIGSDAAFQVKQQQRKEAFDTIYQTIALTDSLGKNMSKADELRKSEGLAGETIERGFFQKSFDKLGDFVGVKNLGDILGLDFKGLSEEDVQFKYLLGKYNESVGQDILSKERNKPVNIKSLRDFNYNERDKEYYGGLS